MESSFPGTGHVHPVRQYKNQAAVSADEIRRFYGESMQTVRQGPSNEGRSIDRLAQRLTG
ncbi:MAG: hypothetical protein K0Q94_2938 [Paenibacillus sp.]|nr:hypothetical protein [Paenibacillus sp.]